MAVARAVRCGTHSRWTTEYASLSEAASMRRVAAWLVLDLLAVAEQISQFST